MQIEIKRIDDFNDYIIVLDSSYNEYNKNARPETLFVVDKNNRLLGVVQKENFYNYIDAQYHNLHTKIEIEIEQVMNNHPKSVPLENCEELAKRIFFIHSNIKAIPVVDDDFHIISIIVQTSQIEKVNCTLPFTTVEIESVFDKYNMAKNNWHYNLWLTQTAYSNLPVARKYLLNYLYENISKNAKILDVACGTGIMSFFFESLGFKNIHSFDYDKTLISIANNFASLKNSRINFKVDDAFNPSCDLSDVDVAVFYGWVGCAHGFNDALKDSKIDDVLDSLFTTYNLKTGTYVFLDVYDDLSNYRYDKAKSYIKGTISAEDLLPIFKKHGYEIVDKCYDSSYFIKVIYVLKKISITKRVSQGNENCNLPFSIEEIEAIFNKYDINYYSWHYNQWLTRNTYSKLPVARKFLLDWLCEKLPKEAKILDVACGTGVLSLFLESLGFSNIHAFDFDKTLINIAKEFAALKGSGIDFEVDDAFNPSCDLSDIDVAIFYGWVGCAQGFTERMNDNNKIDDIVDRLFETYKFNTGTHIFFDVYDDLSNYRYDKEKESYIKGTISAEDLLPIFKKHGYEIVDKCCDINNLIKVIYVLKKV